MNELKTLQEEESEIDKAIKKLASIADYTHVTKGIRKTARFMLEAKYRDDQSRLIQNLQERLYESSIRENIDVSKLKKIGEKIIREKCIEANPSILDLKFGCRGSYEDEEVLLIRYGIDFDNVDGPDMYVWQKANGGRVFRSQNEGIEIIGRDIRLADVLLAMAEIPSLQDEITVDTQGVLSAVSWEEEYVWNLLDDNYLNQSDETKLFIANLLK